MEHDKLVSTILIRPLDANKSINTCCIAEHGDSDLAIAILHQQTCKWLFINKYKIRRIEFIIMKR